MLAEATTLTATDVAGNVHLRTWLCEWEIAWTQTNLGVCSEHLTGKGQKDLLQVGKGNVLVDIESFYLMEEAVCACRNSLVAVNASRADDADWRL